MIAQQRLSTARLPASAVPSTVKDVAANPPFTKLYRDLSPEGQYHLSTQIAPDKLLSHNDFLGRWHPDVQRRVLEAASPAQIIVLASYSPDPHFLDLLSQKSRRFEVQKALLGRANILLPATQRRLFRWLGDNDRWSTRQGFQDLVRQFIKTLGPRTVWEYTDQGQHVPHFLTLSKYTNALTESFVPGVDDDLIFLYARHQDLGHFVIDALSEAREGRRPSLNLDDLYEVLSPRTLWWLVKKITVLDLPLARRVSVDFPDHVYYDVDLTPDALAFLLMAWSDNPSLLRSRFPLSRAVHEWLIQNESLSGDDLLHLVGRAEADVLPRVWPVLDQYLRDCTNTNLDIPADFAKRVLFAAHADLPPQLALDLVTTCTNPHDRVTVAQILVRPNGKLRVEGLDAASFFDALHELVGDTALWEAVLTDALHPESPFFEKALARVPLSRLSRNLHIDLRRELAQRLSQVAGDYPARWRTAEALWPVWEGTFPEFLDTVAHLNPTE